MKPTKAINVDFAKKVAVAYGEMKHNPHNPKVRWAYSCLKFEVIEQYKAILDLGLRVEFDNGQSWYNSPMDAVNDMAHNNHLYVFPTEGNFGSNKDFDPEGNPLLLYSGLYISGKPSRINDLFRAVHDYYGHYKGGNGFRALGEENAFRYHCSMFSPSAQKALTTETRGQNCWLNYGPHGEHNRTAKQADTIFADQKTGLLPEFCYEYYL